MASLMAGVLPFRMGVNTPEARFLPVTNSLPSLHRIIRCDSGKQKKPEVMLSWSVTPIPYETWLSFPTGNGSRHYAGKCASFGRLVAERESAHYRIAGLVPATTPKGRQYGRLIAACLPGQGGVQGWVSGVPAMAPSFSLLIPQRNIRT